MTFRRSSVLVVAAVAVLAAAAVYWLAQDYLVQRRFHREVMAARANTIISSLKAGVRSHRRVGNWFHETIDAVLKEIAATEDVRGVAIINDEGRIIASGGEFPSGMTPAHDAQWTTAGLLFARRTQIVDAREGAQPEWRGRGRRAQQEPEIGAELRNPVWIAVLLDTSGESAAIARANTRFMVSIVIAVALLAATVLAVFANSKHARLAGELQAAREHQARLEELTRLGAGLAHETKNPLCLIRAIAQGLSNEPGVSEERRHDARLIVDEADRVVSRINGFLAYARPQQPRIINVDLRLVLEETAALFRDEAESKAARIRVAAESAVVLADADMLRRLLVNVLANSVAACGGSGCSIELRAARDGHDSWLLQVDDTGSGIAPEDLPEVTKAYFTRSPNGTGLGLAIVEQIVEAHGWTLDISSEPGRGTSVTIRGIREAAA